ncbi:putative zinc-binding metallopeptidase [Nocardia sp. 348MFTsu5.1]|uniref:zinc-binding metallopeptidase family protein n=1 Tax=Nocardia sp. 348MFTsu5.1 TaxID=1172185 RepID=UPI0004913B98|nr:putative zinc-binding metallopeptidase [Nocardia sp. 348MFTsu5.1]
MRAFDCPECGGPAPFEAQSCPSCQVPLAFHVPSMKLVAIPGDSVTIDGTRLLRCSNWAWECNWLVADDSGSGQCFAGSFIRARPAGDDTLALERLAQTAKSLRRLLYQLIELELPVEPYYRQGRGLAFDLISSRTSGTPVVIGHANGVITIDLAESLDEHRESLRVRLGEPYRTMLGHFRHEVGHYYQSILVENGRMIDECRELFGDERASYTDALDRHYKFGAPEGWEQSYISEYATMHPWEDFAECFAHYLHISDTLDTAAESGLVVQAERVRWNLTADVVPRSNYAGSTIESVLADWQVLAGAFNRINQSMGKRDLYPFTISEPVVRKLEFVHRVVVTAGDRRTVSA